MCGTYFNVKAKVFFIHLQQMNSVKVEPLLSGLLRVVY
jgi:hypothetical protein